MIVYILLSFVVLLGIFLIYKYILTRISNFQIDQKNYRLCPTVTVRDQEENNGLLNNKAVVFVIQGYNYSDTPKILRDDDYILPLQYNWDYTNATYYITMDSTGGNIPSTSFCKTRWILETSDDVKPVVTEGYSQRRLNVRRVKHYNQQRYNVHTYAWKISCS